MKALLLIAGVIVVHVVLACLLQRQYLFSSWYYYSVQVKLLDSCR